MKRKTITATVKGFTKRFDKVNLHADPTYQMVWYTDDACKELTSAII